MTLEPREVAVVESYPTFWDDIRPLPTPVLVDGEDAYMAFVNLTEGILPADPDSVPDAD